MQTYKGLVHLGRVERARAIGVPSDPWRKQIGHETSFVRVKRNILCVTKEYSLSLVTSKVTGSVGSLAGSV